ncbi:MAG TPA: IS110 family transposase [Candidatus Faecousia excrementigallinarum]|uniref:IS110 family transposase n=1 Tax=Candidatus Faecousia excrementigallinarum TaxID=2840806 RepID=A0A9D0Z1E2_9FIRM|nr:IS110 family transposase [Candidatus Faecousia excrementigallinarum]
MIYVGIDIASEKHDCCILGEHNKKLESFSFSNTRDGFISLLAACKKYAEPEQTKIGLESTGIYGDNLRDFLRRNGYEIRTFNPLLIKKSMQATTLRKTKTDKSDASFLASYLARELPDPDPQISYHISELKSLTRARFSVVGACSKAKTQLKALLVQVFPEFHTAFSDVFGVAAIAILRKYPTAKKLSAAKKTAVAKILSEASRHRLGEEKAAMLIDLAKNSVGCHSETKALEMQYYLDQIELNTAYIRRYEAAIREIMNEIDSPITTIPGIGLVLGAMILAELGDVTRFATPEKVLAFAGLDPSIYQSGKYTPASGTMVKRGSPQLRWALLMAARSTIVHNPNIAIYYQKKLSEGKHYNVICSHIAKKLVRILYSLLKKNTPYSLFYPQISA